MSSEDNSKTTDFLCEMLAQFFRSHPNHKTFFGQPIKISKISAIDMQNAWNNLIKLEETDSGNTLITFVGNIPDWD
jgi:hypothetical protein